MFHILVEQDQSEHLKKAQLVVFVMGPTRELSICVIQLPEEGPNKSEILQIIIEKSGHLNSEVIFHYLNSSNLRKFK